MSSTTADPGNQHVGFLPNYYDAVVYASCIGGILGIVLLFAIAGFLLEQFGYLNYATSNKNEKHKQQLKNAHKHGDTACNNHYPGWYYAMTALATKDKPQSIDQQDPISYVNEMFSGIGEEDNIADGNTVLAYEKENKVKKQKEKPWLFLAYKKKNRKDKNGDNQKDKRKLFINTIANSSKQDKKKKNGKSLLMESSFLHQRNRKQNEENKDQKIMLPENFKSPREKDYSLRQNQLVEYENAKAIGKINVTNLERNDTEVKTKKKIKIEQKTTSKSLASPVEEDVLKIKKRRIPTEKQKKTVKETIEKTDDFLY